MTSLTAYGHSWVRGAGASSSSHRLVDLAARRLDCHPTNLGAGGALSTDTAELLSREPAPRSRFYLLMTGLNDARLHGVSSHALDAFGTALQAILRAFEHAGPAAQTIAVEQPHLADYALHAPHDCGSDEIIDTYNERQRAVASRLPAVVLATVTGWDPRTMLAADTVHPNDAGHAQVASAVVRAAEVALGDR